MIRLSYFILLFITQAVSSQKNLVINGSFEFSADSCCTLKNRVNFWRYLENYNDESPWIDLFQANSKGKESTPLNSLGFQIPYDGNSYGALGLYDKHFEMREYLVGNLNDSLKSNKLYRVSFWLSLADSSKFAINSIGVAVSTDQRLKSLSDRSHRLLSEIKPVYNYKDTILNSISDWIFISGTFKAAGGENRIVIGCFNSDKEIKVEDNKSFKKSKTNKSMGLSNSAYYIIDGIKLEFAE